MGYAIICPWRDPADQTSVISALGGSPAAEQSRHRARRRGGGFHRLCFACNLGVFTQHAVEMNGHSDPYARLASLLWLLTPREVWDLVWFADDLVEAQLSQLGRQRLEGFREDAQEWRGPERFE